MRLKQLLGILALLAVSIPLMAAAGPELTQVRVTSQGSATVLTLHATGAFTHTEYRPSDSLLLVDLAGVSPAQLDAKTHMVNAPNLASYRVLGYKSASGADVARVELTVASSSEAKFSESSDDLTISLSAKPGAAAPVSAPAANAQVAISQPENLPAKLVIIRNIGVVREKDGIAVEISANGPLAPKITKLSSPDRLVVDLPNAVSPRKTQHVAVNSAEIKDIRMARYQTEPPVTRVVVDLAAERDFELASAHNHLLVKLHPMADVPPSAAAPVAAAVAASAKANAPEPQLAATPVPGVTNAAASPAPMKAAEFVAVQAEMHPVPKPDPALKANDAASKVKEASDSAFDIGQQSSASLQPLANPNMAFQTGTTLPSSAPVTSKPKYTGEPISVNLKDVDLKDFFRLIHEISGLNVVLDPNVHGTLTIVLDDVPWDQALDIVLKNNGLDRQLEGNVLRIATVQTLRQEADNRRAQIEAQALAVDKVTVTRFLSYAHAADVMPTVKRFLSSRGDVVADTRTNALIIDDIPNVIPKIDGLLVQLDRKTAEVEIEARVVAATRSFERDIGTQMGFGFGINGVSTIGGNSHVGQTDTLVTPNGPAPACCDYVVSNPGSPSTIPLFSNLGLPGPTSGLTYVVASQHFRLDYQLHLLESRGLLKILSRPRIVTQNNIQAVVRQGVRVPITTQGQLNGPPTVSYVDAFLRLSVTPQITAENTIFLNIDVENTVPDFSVTIFGNPQLDTQQATTQVLVTDGGTVVIGGVIQSRNSINYAQVPLLGNIPLLGHLFQRRTASTNTQELIFFITPRIIQT
jgi:type IV pilus assembly protein PilQ